MSTNDKTATNRRFTDQAPGSAGTTIAAGTRIRGTLSGTTPLDISGTIEGGVDVDALVWIRPDGHVQGEINARTMVVEGRLDAQLEVRERIELRGTSEVRGNLRAAAVAIADGAFYEGQVEMPREGGGDATHFKEKRGPGKQR